MYEELKSILANEDFLIDRILKYATEQKYTDFTSTLRDAWSLSIRGLTNCFLSFLEEDHSLVFSPYEKVPISLTNFAIIEAKKHRERGITLRMFLGLFKYYKKAYLDLVKDSELTDVINFMFDAIEIEFCEEWSNLSPSDKVYELALTNRELTNEKNKYLTIFHSFPTPCFFVDAKGNLKNINRKALEKYYPEFKDNLYNNLELTLILPQWLSNLLPLESNRIEKYIDGEYLVINSSSMQDVSGKFTGTLILIEDFTDKCLLEQDLKKSKGHYELLFEEMNEGVVICDPNKDYEITSINSAMERLVDIPKDILIGNPLNTIFPFAEDIFKEMGETEQSVNERYFSVRSFPHADKVAATIVEITDRKLMEEHLRHQDKMRAIGVLAGGIAHDFNNILAIIMGFCDLILPESQGKVKNSVDNIINAGNRAKDLVKQLLTFSKIESDQELVPVDIKALTKDVVSLMRAITPASIEINTMYNIKQYLVNSDAPSLHQAFINIISNAVKAVKEGGVINIELNEEIRNTIPYLKVSVIDNGKGMEKELISRIFEPYFSKEGHGLGLAIVHGIISRHNGFIEIDSIIDQGTKFNIFLPKIVNEETVRDSIQYRGTGNILLVDDEDILASVTEQNLVALGYEVATFTDPEDALYAFLPNKDLFDLVITDQTMPKMLGTELARRIKYIRDVPIILISGFGDLCNKSRDIDAYVAKPIDRATLSRIIKEVGENYESKNKEDIS